jgi:hypothetical protein
MARTLTQENLFEGTGMMRPLDLITSWETRRRLQTHQGVAARRRAQERQL